MLIKWEDNLWYCDPPHSCSTSVNDPRLRKSLEHKIRASTAEIANCHAGLVELLNIIVNCYVLLIIVNYYTLNMVTPH